MYSIDFENVDLVSLLERCGHTPVFQKGDAYWFLSPFREESKPSFQVRGNLFNDWGDPNLKGGVLDLTSHLFNIPRENTKELFQQLNNIYGGVVPTQTRTSRPRQVERERENKVIAAYPLNNQLLISYLEKRGVLYSVAARFTQTIVYLNSTRDKKLYGIGFPNKSGGYELRSEYSKRSFYPKDISILNTGGVENQDKKFAVVFEGFMDALSYLSQKVRSGQPINFDCMVLNGVGMVHRAVDELKDYGQVYGLLDNDDAGTKCTEVLAANLPNFTDSRAWLGKCKDVNEKVVSIIGASMELKQSEVTKKNFRKNKI